MANCHKCGAELFETSKFCPSCGEPVAAQVHAPEETTDGTEFSEGISPETEEILEENAVQNSMDISGIKKQDEPGEEALNKDIPEEEAQPAEAAPKEETQTKKEEVSVTPEQSEPEQASAGEEPYSEKHEETVYISDEPPKKKAHTGVIIAAAAVVVIAVVAVFAINGKVSDVPVAETESFVTEMTEVTDAFEAETTETEAETAVGSSEVSETAAAAEESEAVTSSAAESISESSVTETSDVQTSAPETTAAPSSESETAASMTDQSPTLPAEGIVVEPEHKIAMGNSVSASVSLSDQGIGTDMLTDEVIVIADFSTDAVINGATPVIMAVAAGETEIQITASSSSEGQAYFEYAEVLASLSEAGLSPESVDVISFKTTGIPIDVFSVTFIK